MKELFTDEEFRNAKSEDKLPLRCEECGCVFYSIKKAIKYEREHKRGRCKFCSTKCANTHFKKEIKTNCVNCGKEISVINSEFKRSKTKHFFCSHSCSATYNNSLRGGRKKETKRRIREKIIKTNKKKGIYVKRICKICGNEYVFNKRLFPESTRIVCSKKCSDILREERIDKFKKLARLGGLKSCEVQRKRRRSLNEIYFSELCKNYFKEEILCNESMFNGWDADVILKGPKIAVLWNGVWHYKTITKKHSLKQVKNRDKIKIDEIKKCGYTPYIIKDMGKHNKEFVEKEFNKFLDFVKK